MPSLTVRLPLLLTGCALVLLLAGCRYTFLPLVPTPVEVNLPTRITNATLSRDGDVLRLQAQIDGRFEPGFLSVRWFDGSRELGTDNVYLDGTQRVALFLLNAPSKGAYRAVLSFSGVVLRQLELYEVLP